MNWEKELNIAKRAAIEAGKAIMEIYCSEELGVTYKEDKSPLTRADRQANKIIVEMLSKEFPGYAILSEEEKDNKETIDERLLLCSRSVGRDKRIYQAQRAVYSEYRVSVQE